MGFSQSVTFVATDTKLRSNEMTRETAKSKIRMSVTVNKDYIKSLEKSDEVIDQIYNDHEVAIEILLKANEEEVNRHFNECEKYEAQLKAKDKITQDIKEAYELKSIAYDLLLKAIKLKDEEIERLEADKECAKDVINWHEKECKQYIKLHHTKARSIVAMLFWRARKDKRLADEENRFFTYDMALHSFTIFRKAYRMLKEQQ